MKAPHIELHFRCSKCGSDLQVELAPANVINDIVVDPCVKCLLDKGLPIVVDNSNVDKGATK
jgi:hypothetical protein